MKWFKHYTDASRGALLEELANEFGKREGHGAYWLVVEYLTLKWDGKSEPKFRVRASDMRRFLEASPKFIRNFSAIFEQFPGNFWKISGNFYEIEYPKLAEILHRDTIRAGAAPALEEEQRPKRKKEEGDARANAAEEPAAAFELSLEDVRMQIDVRIRNSWASKYTERSLAECLERGFEYFLQSPRKRQGRSLAACLVSWVQNERRTLCELPRAVPKLEIQQELIQVPENTPEEIARARELAARFNLKVLNL